VEDTISVDQMSIYIIIREKTASVYVLIYYTKIDRVQSSNAYITNVDSNVPFFHCTSILRTIGIQYKVHVPT
jgi:hypothetical protein